MKKILILLFFISFFGLANADIVYFKDGTSIEGEVVSEDNQSIKIKQYINSAVNTITYSAKIDVSRIEKKPLAQLKDAAPSKAKEENFEVIKISKPTKPKVVKIIKKDEPVNNKISKDKEAGKEIVQNKEVVQLSQEKEKIIPVNTSNASKENLTDKTKALEKIVKEAIKEKPKPIVLPVREVAKEKEAVAKNKTKTEKKLAQASKKETPKFELNFFKAKPKELFGYKVISRNKKDFIGSENMDRVEYLISVPVSVNKLQLEKVFSEVLNRELGVNKDLDALWVTVYADGSKVNDMPRAYGIWSPRGGWDDFENTADKSKYTWSYRFLY